MQLLCYFYWKQILKLLAVPHDHALSPTFCMHLPLKMEADDRYYTVKKKNAVHFLAVLVCPPHFFSIIFYCVYNMRRF